MLVVAREENEVGEALIDWHTPAQFGIGVAAGALGVSPLLATAIFIGLSTVKLAMSEGAEDALFSPAEGESHANELVDLGAKFFGYWVGQKARSMIRGSAAPLAPLPSMSGKIVGMGMAPGDRALLASPVLIAPPQNG